MADNANVDQLDVLISKALTEYKDVTMKDLKKATKRAAKTVEDELREHAPKKTGRYRESWRTRTLTDSSSKIELVVFSTDRYMLTHLLENGHAIRTGGRVPGIPHIKPAEEKGNQQFENEIREALKG